MNEQIRGPHHTEQTCHPLSNKNNDNNQGSRRIQLRVNGNSKGCWAQEGPTSLSYSFSFLRGLSHSNLNQFQPLLETTSGKSGTEYKILWVKTWLWLRKGWSQDCCQDQHFKNGGKNMQK